MKNNDWYDVGKQIKDLVQNAIDTKNYAELNRTISNTISNTVGGAVNGVNEAVQEVKEELESYGLGYRRRGNFYQRNRFGRERYSNREQRKDTAYSGTQKTEQTYTGNSSVNTERKTKQELVLSHPSGEISGPIMAAIGYLLAGGTGIMLILLLILTFTSGYLLVPTTLFAFLFVGGIGLGTKGNRKRKRIKRFRRYVEILNNRTYCQIEEISQKTGKSIKFVQKDLQSMFERGFFRQAHFDKQKTCFMISDETYEHYIEVQREYEEKQKAAAQEIKKEAEHKEDTPDIGEEYRMVMEEGNAYISHIRACNDAIPGVEISEKLDKLEMVVERIFEAVKKKQELAPELHKILEYYLPTTRKLLDAYVELDAQPEAGTNIVETKREIEKTIETISGAFENFLDGLFKDQAWDIQSDISVLQTMLKQDGYIKSDFES